MKRVYETPTDGHYFFGYYDKSPLNKDNSKLLACRASFIDRMPTADDVLEIGYLDWKNSNEFIKLTETKAWNWQQGCMLQWLAPKYDEKIIYNDRVDDKFVTVIFDIKSREKNILPMAYYTMSSNGDFVLCIDNERHYWFRSGYNYQGIENIEKKISIDKNDGIWRIDIKTNELKQIISLNTLLKFKPLSNMENTIHYVEHLMMSPCNERFAFLHRWQMSDGGVYTRLYSANVNGSEIHLLNDSGRMSHFCWKNSKEIVAWGGLSNPINSLRKYKTLIKFFIKPLMPFYKKFIKGNSVDGNSGLSKIINGDSYIVFEDKTNNRYRLASDVLDRDGHPSFSMTNDSLMLSDTYPDIHNEHKQELFLFDTKENKKYHLDFIKHNESFFGSTNRCDLHPKWSLDGKYVSIDCLEKDNRSMKIYKVYK